MRIAVFYGKYTITHSSIEITRYSLVLFLWTQKKKTPFKVLRQCQKEVLQTFKALHNQHQLRKWRRRHSWRFLHMLEFLFLFPILHQRMTPFVKYHIKQGAVLVVIELIVWFAGTMVWGLYPLLMLVNVATLVLSIMGILNVLNGKEKELPLVGRFSKNFNI